MTEREALLLWVPIWEIEEHATEGTKPIAVALRKLAEVCCPEPERPTDREYDDILAEARSQHGGDLEY